MRYPLSVADFQESVSFLLHTAREVRLSPDTLAHFLRLGARALCPLAVTTRKTSTHRIS